MLRQAMILGVASALAAGCGVFEDDWQIGSEYCESAGDHLEPPNDVVKTNWWSKSITVDRAAGVDWTVDVERIEDGGYEVWGTSAFGAADEDVHCVKIIRADTPGGEEIEMFVLEKVPETTDCGLVITHTIEAQIRMSACPGGHSGGWRGNR